MLMLDLCSGFGGASQAMRDRSWQVVTVDVNPQLSPDVTADICHWSWTGPTPDLIWASPPCHEFSREFMPWSRTGQTPSIDIVHACKRVIDQARPRFWILENVKGAVPFLRPSLGPPRRIIGPYYLWGYFPPLGTVRLSHQKQHYPGQQPALRAKIPLALSLAVATAIERQPTLPTFHPSVKSVKSVVKKRGSQ